MQQLLTLPSQNYWVLDNLWWYKEISLIGSKVGQFWQNTNGDVVMYVIDIVLVYVLQQIWYCCWQIKGTVIHQSKGEVTERLHKEH